MMMDHAIFYNEFRYLHKYYIQKEIYHYCISLHVDITNCNIVSNQQM